MRKYGLWRKYHFFSIICLDDYVYKIIEFRILNLRFLRNSIPVAIGIVLFLSVIAGLLFLGILMSYVGTPFEYDVFLSYAHGGNLLKQWSISFAEQLIAELKGCKELEHKISVFYDSNPDPKLSLDKMAPLSKRPA